MKVLFARRHLLILAPLALASCGGAPAEEGAGEAAPVALVRTAPALAGAASDMVELYGTAEAGPEGSRALSVASEAIVSAIHAPAGTAVRAGDAVITLRPSPRAQADLVRAANEAKVARAAYARAMRLRADGLVGDGEVEAARGAAGTADAALIAARSGGTLRAAVAGTVQGLTVQGLTVQGLALRPGDLVPAGTTIGAIAGAGDRRARFGLDPALASRLHPGQPIRITAAGGDLVAETTVLGVDPAGDATTRQASVLARVPQGVGIGQALKASVALGTPRAALTIPYAALLDDAGKSFVFVVSGGLAHRRAVEPGSSSADRIAILHGLQAGERVVTEGGTALEDGMKIREDQAR